MGNLSLKSLIIKNVPWQLSYICFTWNIVIHVIATEIHETYFVTFFLI